MGSERLAQLTLKLQPGRVGEEHQPHALPQRALALIPRAVGGGWGLEGVFEVGEVYPEPEVRRGLKGGVVEGLV